MKHSMLKWNFIHKLHSSPIEIVKKRYEHTDKAVFYHMMSYSVNCVKIHFHCISKWQQRVVIFSLAPLAAQQKNATCRIEIWFTTISMIGRLTAQGAKASTAT
jgi:hypothetical protein